MYNELSTQSTNAPDVVNGIRESIKEYGVQAFSSLLGLFNVFRGLRSRFDPTAIAAVIQ